MKMNVFVLYGGRSAEHEVSLRTAFTVLGAMDTGRYDVYPVYITPQGLWCCSGVMREPFASKEDLVQKADGDQPSDSIGGVLSRYFSLPGKKAALPLLHGSYGEDGTVQGLLELLDIPYVGNGVLSAALTMDKAMCKKVLEQEGIAQTKHVTLGEEKWLGGKEGTMDWIESEIGYPCYVKPASLGSSIGISRCLTRNQLEEGIAAALRYDRKLVVEAEIVGREIQVAVMGNGQPLASLPGEFLHGVDFFDFDAKYMDKSLKMSVPAELPSDLLDNIRALALRAYTALDCAGLARVDFFVDADGGVFLNEINALPGFTGTSMYPVMWERTAGIPYGELLERLLDYGIARHEGKRRLQYDR
ncbi:D-alanine--D-alanine ligase family protein [Paenibacillus sp. CAU 1782]